MTSCLSTFAKVAVRLGPLKGVVANCHAKEVTRVRTGRPDGSTSAFDHKLTIISYTRIPSVHQSTADVWPFPLMTSGAIYSSVPTNELVRKSAMHDLVSTSITPFWPLLERTTVGAPAGPVLCFERSKSDNMICPD